MRDVGPAPFFTGVLHVKVVNRKGFTLVELLVVITIIGMLMALLFPAVQAAREAGRGNTCRNNMRNVAFAVKYYENRNNVYPAFYQYDRNTAQNNFGYRSLVYHLLPDLERVDAYEANNIDNMPGTVGTFGSGIGVYLNILVCPSDPQPIGDQGNYPTAYAYNAGTPVDTTATFERANGIFGSRSNVTSIGLWNTCNSEAFVSLHDGAATTLMISENLDASAWNDWSEIRVGFGWDDYPVAQWINRKINAQNKGTSGPIGSVQTSNWNGSTSSTVFTKPSSTHPGSVNVAFADMHVRPLNQDIGYHVYAQLCTPWGRQARDSGGGAINQWGTLNTYMQQPLNEQDIR